MILFYEKPWLAAIIFISVISVVKTFWLWFWKGLLLFPIQLDIQVFGRKIDQFSPTGSGSDLPYCAHDPHLCLSVCFLIYILLSQYCSFHRRPVTAQACLSYHLVLLQLSPFPSLSCSELPLFSSFFFPHCPSLTALLSPTPRSTPSATVFTWPLHVTRSRARTPRMPSSTLHSSSLC